MEERLNRGEYEAVRCLLGAVNYMAHARDGLKGREGAVTNGPARMTVLVEGVRAFADELLDTVPTGQCKQLRNTMMDMEIRMVPKRMPKSQNVVLEKDHAKALVDIAMDKCHGCVEDEKSCLDCALYKVLVSFLPLDSYENGMLCPYSLSEWKD